VERKEFVRRLRLQGLVAAVNSTPIAAPRLAVQGNFQLTITRLAPSGARVRKGDLLVEFDSQDQVRAALDRRAEYLDLEEQIKRKVAEHATAQARDDTAFEEAKNLLASARLEMRKNEVISRIDVEKNEQNLKEAEARLKQFEQTYELRKTARQAELRILEIRRDRSRQTMLYAERNAEKLSIKSPIEGIVVLNSIWKGSSMAEVVEGDQVRPGVPLLQVVSPNAMEVRARVNQADVPFLKEGQPAEVRMDAYPDLSFPARLERIAAVGVAGGFNDRVRTFNVTFSVTGNDPKLLPDLAAAVDTEIDRRPAALVIPRDAVIYQDGKTFVRVRTGNGWEKREIKISATADIEVAIESGLKEGEEVQRRGGEG
ncbi:MAG TPA: HlyD family efflux transporter periplasmic adaptor subunit, partial [Candidatus Nitrosotenuis sp.]|nr:HlyD family efflux transporter periplasmic adaptor subunit [Candidatus Nitrosotenuis sp.]